MFFFRTIIVVAAGVMLMPLDEPQQANLVSHGGTKSASSPTFCERHPSTCAAGGELWGTFKKKAEVALVLGVKMAVDYARQGHERGAVVNADHDNAVKLAPATRNVTARNAT